MGNEENGLKGDNVNRIFKTLRFVAGCALLGAVTMGIVTGWIDHPPVDFHAFGALVGLAAGSAVKAFHIA